MRFAQSDYSYEEMNKIQKQLLKLAIEEFAAAGVFAFLYSQLNIAFNTGVAVTMAFSYLVFILLQGSGYWLYRYRLIRINRTSGRKAVGLLKLSKWLNLAILIVLSVLIPVISRRSALIIAMAVLLFGTIEYVNYYWYRLSYGKTGFNISTLLNTALKKSSINKLINSPSH